MEGLKILKDQLMLHHFHPPSRAQDEVFPTSYVTAHYLRHILRVQGRVFLLGTPGIARELELQDIEHFGTGVRGCMDCHIVVHCGLLCVA